MLALSDTVVLGAFGMVTAMITAMTTIIVAMLARANTRAKDTTKSIGVLNGHGTIQDQLKELVVQSESQKIFRAEIREEMTEMCKVFTATVGDLADKVEAVQREVKEVVLHQH